jgi:hypothetical protein
MATVDPEIQRIALLIDGLKELPFEEREARIAELSEEDRNAVREFELEAAEESVPEDDDELGGGD